MEDLDIKQLAEDLKNNQYTSFSASKISEKNLLALSKELKSNEKTAIDSFLNYMVSNSITEACDWNIGSTIQHFNINLIMDSIDNLPMNKRPFLYDSIGISWALGDSNTKNEKVIDFLYEILNYSRNPEAWWRAAFGIEKLTGKNAINNLKRSLKKTT